MSSFAETWVFTSKMEAWYRSPLPREAKYLDSHPHTILAFTTNNHRLSKKGTRMADWHPCGEGSEISTHTMLTLTSRAGKDYTVVSRKYTVDLGIEEMFPGEVPLEEL
jgi:hypothetical protein